MPRSPAWHALLPAVQIALLGLLAWSALRWGGWLWGPLALGGALAAWAVTGLGSSLTPMPAPNGRGLKTAGPYRWIRHPIYAALMLAALGLASGSWVGWVAWTALVVVLLAKVMLEERLLASEYPEYEAYTRRSWRIVPFIW